MTDIMPEDKKIVNITFVDKLLVDKMPVDKMPT
jgi:hypothetical protein